MDHLIAHNIDRLRGVVVMVGEEDPRTAPVFDNSDPPQVISTGIHAPIGSLYVRAAPGTAASLRTLPIVSIKVGPEDWHWAVLSAGIVTDRVPDGQGGFVRVLEQVAPVDEVP